MHCLANLVGNSQPLARSSSTQRSRRDLATTKAAGSSAGAQNALAYERLEREPMQSAALACTALSRAGPSQTRKSKT
jgi:hypothetical protein